jgi:hypothetical protein
VDSIESFRLSERLANAIKKPFRGPGEESGRDPR